MGVRAFFRWLLTGSAQVPPSNAHLVQSISVVARQVAQLQGELEDHKAQYNSFRGRVYAWKRFDEPPEPQEKVQELPLSDPRVPISVVRARLLKPGKPFKHTTEPEEG